MKSQVLIGKTSGQNVSFIFPLGRTFKTTVWLKCQSGYYSSMDRLDGQRLLENHQAILAWQEIKILSYILHFLKYPYRIKYQITKYVYCIFFKHTWKLPRAKMNTAMQRHSVMCCYKEESTKKYWYLGFKLQQTKCIRIFSIKDKPAILILSTITKHSHKLS